MEPSFLVQRQQQLGFFFNSFLAHPLVSTSRLVPVFFSSKAADEESKDAIKKLVDYLNYAQTPSNSAENYSSDP